MNEFQDFVKNDMIPAWKKAGINQLGIWRTATLGEGYEVFIAGPIKALEELDGPDPIVKTLGQEAAAALRAKAVRLITGSRTFMITARPDLSIAPASGYEPKLAVRAVTSVAPGRTADYEKGSKESLAVIGKTNTKGIMVFNGGLGGDPYGYSALVLFDSFADLAQFPAAYAKAAPEARHTPMPPGIVMHTEWSTFRYAPELSIQPPAQ